MRPHHPLKTVEEVAATIPNATMFSILDAKAAFWHIPLDENSSYLTTFNTVFGRYRCLKMPYGLNSGSEVYQQTIEQLMETTPCKIIVDDILVYGTDTKDHDINMKIVLDRIREIKSEWAKMPVSFARHQICRQYLYCRWLAPRSR